MCGIPAEQGPGALARRRDIIDATPELQERELRKRAALTDAIAATLRARGVDPGTAILSARAGMVVQQTAIQQWTQSTDDRSLRDHLSGALEALRATVAQTASQGRSRPAHSASGSPAQRRPTH